MKLLEYQKLENFLIENQSIRYGAYVCSCGYAYFIEPCGLPYEESDFLYFSISKIIFF